MIRADNSPATENSNDIPHRSPPNVLRLASSEDHGPLMLLVNEEFTATLPNLGGDPSEYVRADLGFFE